MGVVYSFTKGGNMCIRLEHTSGGHNKFYEMQFIQSKDRIAVRGLYGAIGQAPKETTIYDGSDEMEALTQLKKKQQEKQKKGYIVVSQNGNTIPAPAPPQKKNTECPAIWPMNAQGVKNDGHLQTLLNDDNYVAQEKLDGMRAVIHVTNKGLRIFSRSAGVANPTMPLEKTSSLPHLAALTFPDRVGTVLDAEILIAGKDCAALSGAVHKKDVGTDNHMVTAFVFDILRLNGVNLTGKTLTQRITMLETVQSRLQSQHIIFLPWAKSSKDKRCLYETILATGKEGIMLKRLDATYVEGGRPSNNWIKAKKSATFDCVVLGFSQGAGKYNTQIGAVIFGQYRDGKLIQLGQASGMTDSIRGLMSKYPEQYLGRVAEIKGMERLRSGALRHPQFVRIRTDKRPSECQWNANEQ
jgi:ATP-dependent DNA ligase